jgi:CRP/FNR family transcriptional regulator
MSNLDALIGKFGKSFKAREHVFYEGDEGNELYLVHSGEVRIYKTIGDKELTLSVLHKDEFFGEVAALLGEYRTASAVATQDTTVIVFPTDLIEKVITNQTEVAVRLLKLMARRLKAADDLISILMQNNPQARVVLGLIRLVEDKGEQTKDGILVTFDPGTLASQVEVSSEDVKEVFKVLAKKKIIAPVGDGQLHVTSMDDLAEFYQFLELQDRFG